MNRNQALAMCTPGFDPYAGHADTAGHFGHFGHQVRYAWHRGPIYGSQGDCGWFGSKLVHSISKVASRGLHDLTHPKDFVKDNISVVKYSYKNVVAPAVSKALPIVQTILKNAGPMGMVASGALSAMKAGLSGKNLESIAWAAAEGAAPSGIDKAIAAAEAIRHGGNIISAAVNAGVSHFIPGSPEHLGYESAIAALKSTASKAALGAARNALPSEGAKKAFDAAIGTAAKAVSHTALVPRGMSIPNVNLSRPKAMLSAIPSATKGIIDAMHKDPSLLAMHPSLLASKFRTNGANIKDAILAVNRINVLPWRSMSPGAVSYIRRYAPHSPLAALRHAHTDTGGLDSSGTKYIVVAGDSPWAIAQKLTGNGANWTALKALNTDKKPDITKNVWVGEVLNIPASWQKPTNPGTPAAPALPNKPAPVLTLPVPPSSPASDVLQSVLQAKSILVAWSKTDGNGQAGLTDYGTNVADLSTTMGPRDTLELASFQAWNNKTLNSSLNTSGNLDAATLLALQSWAEAKAATVPVGVATFPNLPGAVTQVIPTVIGGTAPPAPPPPGVPALPSGASPLPVVASSDAPATPGKVAAQSKGTSLPVVATGAVVGGLIFGVPGALAGAALGAAVS